MPDLRAKAALLRVLGHPIRLAIVSELAAGPKCVTDIQELVGVQQANVSQHLTALRHERIVDFHEDGKLRCYYIARPGLARVILRLIQGEFPVVSRSKQAVRRASQRRRVLETADGMPVACNAKCQRAGP
jgi:ArsR family transcriptional regulator, arsenate/arsenite/antimonite-responsive transcriptional repressor